MATINPTLISNSAPGVEVALWETLTESDTAAAYAPGSLLPLVGSLQVVGTFGGGTIVFQGSNDGTNWVSLNDTSGDAITLTAAGAAEFSTAMRYIRPAASVAGTGRDVDVYMVLRY